MCGVCYFGGCLLLFVCLWFVGLILFVVGYCGLRLLSGLGSCVFVHFVWVWGLVLVVFGRRLGWVLLHRRFALLYWCGFALY